MVLVVKRRTRALASYGRRRPNVALYRSWMLTERAFGQSESVWLGYLTCAPIAEYAV
jgi:hypothetical protein